jgi:hypothetical protein
MSAQLVEIAKLYDNRKSLLPPKDIPYRKIPDVGVSPLKTLFSLDADANSNETFNFLAKLDLSALEKCTKMVMKDYTNKITFLIRVVTNFMNCVSDLLKDSHNPKLKNA